MNEVEKKKKALVLAAIVLVSVLGVYFVLIPYLNPTVDDKGVRNSTVHINEVNYMPEDVDDEFIEIYCFENLSSDFSGWKLAIDGGSSYNIPDVDLEEYDFLAVHFGTDDAWSDEISGQGEGLKLHTKHVFLELNDDVLDNDGGAVKLIDEDGYIVDSVVWGETEPKGISMWDYTLDAAKSNNSDQSLSLWGYNLNSSENWYSSVPSPARPNVDFWAITSPAVQISVHNGFYNPPDENVIVYLEGVNISVVAHPTAAGKKAEIEEYAAFSLKYFKAARASLQS